MSGEKRIREARRSTAEVSTFDVYHIEDGKEEELGAAVSLIRVPKRGQSPRGTCHGRVGVSYVTVQKHGDFSRDAEEFGFDFKTFRQRTRLPVYRKQP